MSSYIPFAQREEFKDIVPILQDDGPNPLVPIAYTQQCQFQRISRMNEADKS